MFDDLVNLDVVVLGVFGEIKPNLDFSHGSLCGGKAVFEEIEDIVWDVDLFET